MSSDSVFHLISNSKHLYDISDLIIVNNDTLCAVFSHKTVILDYFFPFYKVKNLVISSHNNNNYHNSNTVSYFSSKYISCNVLSNSIGNFVNNFAPKFFSNSVFHCLFSYFLLVHTRFKE